MKLMKKLCCSSLLALGLLFSNTFSANAAIISQDIIVDGTIFGNISVEVDNAVLNTGILDSAFDSGISLAVMEWFGWTQFLVFDFQAVINTDDLASGIEFLALDVTEDGLDFWTYQLITDTFDPFANFLDIFDENNEFVFFSADVFLGTAIITGLPDNPNPVSAPLTGGIMGLMLAGLLFRRKN